MVITWPNADGTITISQREATEHVMPTVIANPTDIATLAAGNTILSANSTTIAFTYPLPKSAQNAVPMIWSYSTNKPSSSAVDAKLVQHDKMGTATMDLTQSVGALSTGKGATTTVIGTSTQTIIPLPTGASSDGNSSDDAPLPDPEKTIRTHGILMTVGFLVCLPIGIFIARFSRTIPFLKDKWFTAHWFVQFIVSSPIILAGWVTAYNFVGVDHFQDNHRRVGLVLLILYLCQMALGVIIHFFKPKRKPLPPLEPWNAHEPKTSTALQPMSDPEHTSPSARQTYPPTLPGPSTTALVNESGPTPMAKGPTARDTIFPAIKGRPIQNYVHALLGLCLIALALYNVHEGYGYEWFFAFGSNVDEVPFLRHMRAWWTAMVIIIPLVYVAGLSLLPSQWRQETNARRNLPPPQDFRSA